MATDKPKGLTAAEFKAALEPLGKGVSATAIGVAGFGFVVSVWIRRPGRRVFLEIHGPSAETLANARAACLDALRWLQEPERRV